jgi:hypothetical protein
VGRFGVLRDEERHRRRERRQPLKGGTPTRRVVVIVIIIPKSDCECLRLHRAEEAKTTATRIPS